MSTKPMPLAQAISKFVNTLPAEEKQARQQDLAKFLRWFGPDRRLSELNNPVFESRYAQLESSGADPGAEMQALKQFLTYLYKEKLISSNLAKFIKVKRVSRKVEEGAPAPTTTVPSRPAADVVELSAEGLARMKDELDHLTKIVRAQVAQELYDARQDKDIRENAPYDAAKQHQALVESRIRDLERILSSAVLVESGDDGSERTRVGSVVVVHDFGRDCEVQYTLVDTSEADPKAAKISVQSPVGKSLLARSKGEVVEVETPSGVLRYRIERVICS